MKLKFLLIFFSILILINCNKNKAKISIPNDKEIQKKTISKKRKIIKSRVDRIKYRKNKIDSLNKAREWKKTSFDLWIDINGNLGVKTYEGNENGIFIDRYITALCCDGQSLKSIIDTTSFKFIGSSFYKDLNHVYTHYMMSDGGNFQIVEKADVSTFKIIGDCYAKDKNNIFDEKARIIDSIDYKTFKTKKGIGCFAKDKNGYYFWNEKIDLSELTDSIVKDKIIKLKKL